MTIFNNQPISCSFFIQCPMRTTKQFFSLVASIVMYGITVFVHPLFSQDENDIPALKEGIINLVGTSPRQGLGGVVVLLSSEIITANAANQARVQGDPLRVIGYNVYRKIVSDANVSTSIRSIGGNSDWQKLNAEPVAMATTEAFRQKLGNDFFETYKYLVQGKAELEPNSVTPKMAAAKTFATPLQYWEFVSNVGSIEDFTPMFMNAASLPLMGIVYVDSSAVSGQVYEYEVAAVTLGGEGKRESR